MLRSEAMDMGWPDMSATFERAIRVMGGSTLFMCQ